MDEFMQKKQAAYLGKLKQQSMTRALGPVGDRDSRISSVPFVRHRLASRRP